MVVVMSSGHLPTHTPRAPLTMAGTGTGMGTTGEQQAGEFIIKNARNMSLEELRQQLLQWETWENDSYDDWKLDWDIILHDDKWRAAVIVLYVLVMVFGVVANLLIVVVILRYKQLHTVTNVFIVSLGLADIALCAFNLPLQLHYQVTDNWAFGSLLCRVAMASFGLPMFSSSLFILMIAVDRYLLIVYPFKRRMTVRCAVLLVLLIVAFTAAMAVPVVVYSHPILLQEDLVDMHKVVCTETWPDTASKQAYSVTVFLLQFVLPLAFTSVFYAHICHVLRNRPIKKQDTRRSQRTNRILIAVVLTFTLCWLPWNVYILVSEFNHHLVKGKFFRITDLLLKIFAMASACVNPFLYGWLNDNFKKELGKMLGYNALCCRPPQRFRTDNLSMGFFSKTTNVVNNTNLNSPALPLNNFPDPVDSPVGPDCVLDTPLTGGLTTT